MMLSICYDRQNYIFGLKMRKHPTPQLIIFIKSTYILKSYTSRVQLKMFERMSENVEINMLKYSLNLKTGHTLIK